MKFQSKWITTQEFADLKPINVFHREHEETVIPESPVKNCHVHFRKRLSLPVFQRVEMDISADDSYKLYINGAFVSQGPASAYADSYRYNRLDISSFLKEGDNIIAVHVYYNGEINRAYDSGDNRQGMIADIYVDGAYYCGTDSSWRYHNAREYSGEVSGLHRTQFLENMDFRKKEAGWKGNGFEGKDDLPAVVLTEDDHFFRDEPAECLSVYRMLPREIRSVGRGEWLIDFGTEITGQFYMKAKGIRGQRVRILCGEELLEQDPCHVRYDMRCNCRYEETCILSGREDEFEFYDYKAFRYVNVMTDQDNLSPETFCAIVRHHPFLEKCSLVSDVKWAEDIWRLCANTLKWGVQDGFLDCPSREKGQYLGDFTVSGLAYLYLTGDSGIYRKALFDFAETARISRGLLSVAPGSHMQEIADFSLQYPMQVLRYWQYTKDMETLARLYPTVQGVVDYFSRYERRDGLLYHVDDMWNLVDWPSNLRDDYEFPADAGDRTLACHNVLNAHYIGAVSSLQEIQKLLHMDSDNRAERLKAAFRRTFYDEGQGLFRDSQTGSHCALHSNVLPVFYDIAPKEAWESITKLIMEKGLSCGTQFSYFVLKALGKMGAFGQELELITGEGLHSWVNMLKEGATTCFEAWGKEQKQNTSLCHPWSCAPIIVLIEDILKADPAAFGKSEEKTILYLQGERGENIRDRKPC